MLKQVSKSPAPHAAPHAIMLAAAFCLAIACLAPRALAPCASAQTANAASSASMPPLPPDKYLWLEDQESTRALDWVKAEDARSLKILEAEPTYATYYAEALKIAQSPDRLPSPEQRGGDIYNLWRDATHVNGIYRETSLADYLKPHPTWKTIIDYDALGKQDNVKWVAHGLNCLYPGDHYCMVVLSAGGEDADTQREFDLKTGQFLPGGFTLPHSKQSVGWLDKDTLIVARDWGPGTMTASGYPFVVKLWKRGTPLSTAPKKSSAASPLTSAPAATPSTTRSSTPSHSSRATSPSSAARPSSSPPAAPRNSPSPASPTSPACSTAASCSTSTKTGSPPASLRPSSRVRCWR